jgi:hypothetical protein
MFIIKFYAHSIELSIGVSNGKEAYIRRGDKFIILCIIHGLFIDGSIRYFKVIGGLRRG